jgi:hypothetical protein
MISNKPLIWFPDNETIEDKDNTITLILQLADEYEKSILTHSKKLVNLYKNANYSVSEAINIIIIPNKDGVMTNDSLLELSYIKDYISASAFISSWYSFAGEKINRDKATHSCVNIVSSLGLDSNTLMVEYLYIEMIWKELMKKENITPRKKWFGIW